MESIGIGPAFVRIGDGNVMVCGCRAHVSELLVRCREKSEKYGRP
jgi:hypothetical protein